MSVESSTVIDNAKELDSYLSGTAFAPTAEALMRARYYAYTKVSVDFILTTTQEKVRSDVDADHVREWARKSEWLGLKIVSTEEGLAGDKKGKVEFIATYRNGGQEHQHHELSEFVFENGQWFFVDGELVGQHPVRVEEKVGRNDPCSCGSGKKFKKCCG